MIQYAKTCMYSAHSMAETYKHLCDIYTRSDSTVNTIATALASVHALSKTIASLVGRAKTLWCRLSRAGSSSATKTKRPATSEGAGEHSVHVSQRARQVVKKSDYQGWVARQDRGGMEARRRAWDPLKCGGGGGFVPRLLCRRCAHLCADSRRCLSVVQQLCPTRRS